MSSPVSEQDLDSGKVVVNHLGTFYFNQPGENVYSDGHPVKERLHRVDGPALVWNNNLHGYYLNGVEYSKISFDETLKEVKDIDLMDVLLGKVLLIKNTGIFWLKEADSAAHLARVVPSIYNSAFAKHLKCREDDKPSCITTNAMYWLKDGELHREGDKPAIVFGPGDLEYMEHGERHRLNGPAKITKAGRKEWWVRGQLTRLDGPAVIDEAGKEYFFVDGEEYTRSKFKRKMKSLVEC